MMHQDRPESESKSILERMLSVVTEVLPGEGSRTLLLGLNVFVLLLSYYLLKTVREALILAEGGAAIKSYSSAWQALMLMAAIPAYAAFAAHVNRIKLITYVTLFFISNLLLFAVVGLAGVKEGVVFFVWVGIFNLLVIAQFWAFANDLHTEAAGKRLFPVIMLGASLGAIAGGDVAARLMKPLGSYKLMLLSAALLLVCIGITRVIHARAAIVQRVAEIPLKDTGVLELLFKDRYLLMIALLMVLLNLVNSTGEFLLDRFVTAKAILEAGDNVLKRQEIIGQFKGVYFSYANGVGMLLQLFLVSRIFRYAGVGAALLILPAIALTGYSMILAVPVLGIIRWVKIFENGTDYSIQNTVRQALFLPTSREAKYKAKAAIDSFFVRTGDVFSAGLVYVGLNWFALGITGFATVNLVLTLVWIGMAIAIAREYMRRTHIPAPVVSPPVSAAPESANQGAVA